MNVLCIVQARMGSTRLLNKVLMEVKGTPLLEYELKRVAMAKRIDNVVVATTDNPKDDQIEALCNKLGIGCFRGSEDDVLDRYYQCSLKYLEYDTIVRITGDCPLIDPVVIDEAVQFFEGNDYDYVNNHEEGKETFPDGMDVEVFSKKILEEAWRGAKSPLQREHVTLYLTEEEKFKKGFVQAPQNWGGIRLTVDERADFELIKLLIQQVGAGASYEKYVKFLQYHPEAKKLNESIQRNEGYYKALQKEQ